MHEPVDGRSWRLLGLVEGIRATGSPLEPYEVVEVVPSPQRVRLQWEATVLREGITRLIEDGPPCKRTWRESLDDLLNDATR